MVLVISINFSTAELWPNRLTFKIRKILWGFSDTVLGTAYVLLLFFFLFFFLENFFFIPWKFFWTYKCSGYLRKETVSIALPFVYHGLAHFAVHLKNSHRKKEEIVRWTAKKRKKFLDGQWSEWTHGKRKVE